jgi:NMD protein affecting ribosome stability and mRNA decay
MVWRLSLPIFEYAPVQLETLEGSPDVSGRDCCYFEYLHVPGTPSAAPLNHCPRCGNAIERVPARFSAGWSRATKTGNALRSSGKAEFAEAWDEAAASQEKSSARSMVADIAQSAEKTAGGRVTEVLRHHVCTASCDHGPLKRA